MRRSGEVSILVSKGDEDCDFLTKFCQGRLVEFQRNEI